MINKRDEDDVFTVVEPQVSYYSSLINCGVTAIFSNNQIKSYTKVDSLFAPVSPNNNFSLCNTIMLPFIINKEEELDNSNINYNKMNHSAPLIKEKDINHNSLKVEFTRNKTFSSKSKTKVIDDSIKDNLQYDKDPIILGKNMSTKFLIDNNKLRNEELNLIEKNEKLYESDNYNTHRIKGEYNFFMGKEQSRSVNDKFQNSISKDKTEKNCNSFKAPKKVKTKEKLLSKKSNKLNKYLKKKIEKRKSFFAKSQTKISIEEVKDCHKKTTKNFRGTNYSGGDINTKNFYYSNKLLNQNYFKSIIGKKKNNKSKENKIQKIGKSETTRKKKNDNKTSLKEININNKTLKLKFLKSTNIKMNEHKLEGLKLLKEHINNNKEKKEKVAHNSSIELKLDRLINSKNKKIKLGKYPSKTKLNLYKDSDSEEKKKQLKIKIPNRRISGFSGISFKNKFKRRNSVNNNFDMKNIKLSKLKNNKEKDNNLNLRKDNNSKNNSNNTITKNEIDSFKNSYDGKENISKITSVLRRKRSISMHLEKSKLKDVAEAIKQKRKGTESTKNLNKSVNSLSISTNNKQKRSNKKKIDFEKALKKNLKKMQFNLFSKDKFTNTEFSDSDYLKYTLNCMELILDIDIEKQTRLKNKVNFNFPKPKKKEKKKKIALFDLDETLVHCTGNIKEKKDKYQHVIEIKLPGKQAVVQVGINLRPYWKQTINLIKKNYHIVIYTASHQAYADAVLDFMDPKKKYFKYRLYRNNCSLIDVEGAKFYVKDLDILNEHYDLKDVVIIDNSVLSFAYHLHNGIPIVPYYDEDKDGSLYVVGLYLNHIFDKDDLREANKTQINLDSFLEEAKKQREEENEENENENIIDEESNDEEVESKSKKKNVEVEENKKQKDKQDSEIKIKNKRKNEFIKENIINNTRRQSYDFTQKKLISQSKLINLYYEVNDESPKTINYKPVDAFEEKMGNANIFNKVNNSLNNEKNENEKEKNNQSSYLISNDGEIDCKSEASYKMFEQNNFSYNDSNSEEEPVIKRGLTLIEEDKKKIKGKLKNIYSNFFNKFKI